MMSTVIPCSRRTEFVQNQCSAIFTGVVRQALNTSAGRSTDWGKISFAPHAAIRIHSLALLELSLVPKPEGPARSDQFSLNSANAMDPPACRDSKSRITACDDGVSSACCCNFRKDLIIKPAFEQSNT